MLIEDKGWVNRGLHCGPTEGYEEFKEFVKDFTLDKAEETAGLKPEQILELAELIHSREAGFLLVDHGCQPGLPRRCRTAQAIINIALMTGNIGRPGTGANSITGQCNAMGSRAYSNTAVLYAGGDFTNPARRAAVANALGVDESVLAEKPTATYNQIIEGSTRDGSRGCGFSAPTRVTAGPTTRHLPRR